MKLITFHKRNAYIRYKHTICSWAALFVLSATILTVILPFYIAFYMFNDIWSQYKIIYEHPDVKFQYKYIFVAEYTPLNAEHENPIDSTVTTCSSYDYLNELFQDFSECSMIKFWERDSDFDHRIDHMTLQLTFKPPQGYVLNNFNLFLEFYAKLNRQCHLQIPAALLFQQTKVPSHFRGGEIFIESHLKLVQRTGFHCPFFLRQIKSHFYHSIIPENSTNIRDYEMIAIRKKLKNNPAYMNVDQSPVTHWNRIPSSDIVLNIELNIDEVESRYHTSFWQRLGQIWIHYLSIFLVVAYLMEKLKSYIFSRQMIRAWEIIPWKKIY